MPISFFLCTVIYDPHFACASTVIKQKYLHRGLQAPQKKGLYKGAEVLALNSSSVVI